MSELISEATDRLKSCSLTMSLIMYTTSQRSMAAGTVKTTTRTSGRRTSSEQSNMLRMQEKKGFRLIFFSSAEVYGDYDGVMTEDVMETRPIRETYQMNDYAITKWAGELMCMNSATMFDTETVRVRPVNCYGPHEHYTPYRGFIPKFIYHALFDQPYEVYRGHKRIIDYVEDSCRTFANVCDNFLPGEAYNVGGRGDWENDIKHYSDLVLNAVGKDDSLVTYHEAEPFTTKVKHIDFSKAIRDLNHDPQVPPKRASEGR